MPLICAELRDLFVPLVVGVKGDDLKVEACDRILAGLELAEQVGVFFLHLLKELRLPEDVARVCLFENLGEPDGGEPIRGVCAVFICYLGDGDLSRVRSRYSGESDSPSFRLVAHLVASSMRCRAISK